MILVNDPGTWSAIYWPLEHAQWNGWTPTDLIFPFFLFIAGVSMIFSFASRIERGATRGQLALHVLRRSALIFAIGFFLTAFPYFRMSTVRIPGVLPRIAVVYLFAGLIVLAANFPAGRGSRAAIAAIVAMLLLGYWALMTFVPVPGYGTGRLDPEGNLGAYIDRKMMGNHLWSQSKTWDPEGMLSTIPAICTALLGALLGEWLRSRRSMHRKALGMLAAGAVGLIVGRLLHPFFPINKNLWTSTYVIFTAGFAMVLLVLLYWLVDMRGWRRWATPFLVLGMNAIAVFALSTLLTKCTIIFKVTTADGRVTWHSWFYNRFFAPFASPVNASLAFAIFYVLLWLTLTWPLYRKRIFIRI